MGIRTVLLTLGALSLSLAACGRTEPPTTAVDAPSTAAGQIVNTGPPVDGAVTLTAPAAAAAGSTVEVMWTGPGNSGDYIDIVPRGQAQPSGELTYASIPQSIPSAKLRTPTSPGDYDVRYILVLETERKVKAVVPLTVTAVTATVTAPAGAGAAEVMSIAWTGPDGNGDYIDIVPEGHTAANGEITYAYTRSGNPAKLKAPGAAGSYDVRYLVEGTGGRRVLATATVKVTLPEATLKAPDRVKPGETFIVEWTGPKREGDYIDLVKKGYMPTSGELSYFNVDRDVPNQLKAPLEAADYDIRYILQAPNQRVVLAKRPVAVR